MRTYETPGVWFERADASGGGIAALRTDIAGFVGIAGRGPVGIAVPVESYRQFEAWYGGAIDNGYLAYCARAFFENGGRRMWVVRATSDAASAAALTVGDGAAPAWRIEASTPGVYGNDLAVRVTEVRRAQTRATRDLVDKARVHADVLAGFERHSLVEIRSPSTPAQRARIEAIEPARAALVLDRPLAAPVPGERMTVESVAYTIEVFDRGQRVAVFADLSLVPEHPRYGPTALSMPWRLPDLQAPEVAPQPGDELAAAEQFFRVARNRGAAAPPPIVVRELRDEAARDDLRLLVGVSGAQPGTPVRLAGGADGLAALSVGDFIGEIAPATASDGLWADGHRGLAVLDAVEEVALLAVPDIHIQPRPVPDHAPAPECVADPCLPAAPQDAPSFPPSSGELPPRFGATAIALVHAAMVEQCERRRDRIALLDPPYDAVTRLTFAMSALREWRQRFDSAFASLYAPWLVVVDPLRAAPGRRFAGSPLTRAVPPSGHVAGVIAAMDLTRGVHAAPANVPIQWVQGATLPVDDSRHGMLNTLGVNAIRVQPGRGLRVLGARTLSSDPDWLFLNVRRLVSMIEKAIDLSIQWAVFEPNDWRTRAKLALVVGSFLSEWWQRGAFIGATPEEAYYVRCDESNNPPDARARGELLLEVGIAPTVPFEFIVLRIGRDANGFAIRDSDPVPAAA
jgi:phage tail sheath protein FI